MRTRVLLVLPDFDATMANPWWWCAACGDDDHQDHTAVFEDAFGEDHACTCPTCA